MNHLRIVYETLTNVFPVLGGCVGMIIAQDDEFDWSQPSIKLKGVYIGAATGYALVALSPIVIPALPFAYLYKEMKHK
jgi:lipid-binding SYLF domain-containing protein